MSKPFKARGQFQEEGTKFILNNDRCQLHVDMGLGKTIMALNAIDVLIRFEEIKKVLIIAPLRVARTTWKEETLKWDHLKYIRVSTIVGTEAERKRALLSEADVYTINYENLPWLLSQIGSKWPFKMVIADESTKVKGHRSHSKTLKSGERTLYCTGALRTSAIARVAFKKTKRWVNLTGTPAPNGLIDLWGQCWFVDAGSSLGDSHTAFISRWFKTGFNGFTQEMFPHSELEIRNAIAPYTFTLRASDYLTLGEEITNNIFVDLPPKAQRHYDEMEKELFTLIKAGEVEAFNAASRSAKLHQIANGAIYYEDKGDWEQLHDAKIEALQSILEENDGMPIIVVYNFRSDLLRLLKAFPKGKALGKSIQVEADFKAGKIPILFIHPASAGHGIDAFQNVTNVMCFFSVDWNYELRTQVIARIGKVRQFQAGFNRPVYIHQIVARNTIDEIILERLESKCTVEDALKAGLARKGLK